MNRNRNKNSGNENPGTFENLNGDRNDPGNQESEDRLERILKSVREEPVPGFPDPPLVGFVDPSSAGGAAELRDMSSLSQSNPTVVPVAHRSWIYRSLISRRSFQVLAGAAAAIVFSAFILWPQSGQSAFARMQLALQNVRSISYKVMDYHANGDSWETTVMFAEPGHSRSEQIKIGEGRVSNGLQLSDSEKGLRLHIDDQKRTATFYELKPEEGFEAAGSRMIENFRSIPENASQALGPTTFDGRPAHAFMAQLTDGGRVFKVTVDDATSLPVQMEYEQPETGFREVLGEFVFDGDITMDQFALVAPEGYRIVRYRQEEPPADANLFVVSPTTGIGPVPFGSDAQSVIDFLGPPSRPRQVDLLLQPPRVGDQPAPLEFSAVGEQDGEGDDTVNAGAANDVVFASPPGDGQGFEYLYYHALGLKIGINTEYGMTTIRCLGPRDTLFETFAGQTAEGIRIGSTLEQVVSAYGEPDRTHLEVVDYLRKGISFTVIEGKVAGFTIDEPTPEELEIIVHDDGSYTTRVRQPDD